MVVRAQSICGNGVVEGTESCDNGSLNSDSRSDACRETVCSIGGQQCCNSWCGDNVIDSSEECDFGVAGNVAGSGCTSVCTFEGCPNGIVEGTEQCDDGNIINEDGCSAACKVDQAVSCVWVKQFGDADDEVGYSVRETFSNNTKDTPTGYIVVGNTVRQGTSDIWLIKTNMTGETCTPNPDPSSAYAETCYESSEKFVNAFPSPGLSGNDEGRGVQQLFSGLSPYNSKGYVIAGTRGILGSQVYIIKTDVSGGFTASPTTSEDGSGGGVDNGFSVKLAGGAFIVAAQTAFGAGGSDMWLLKYNSFPAVCPYASTNGTCVGAGSPPPTFARTFGKASNDIAYDAIPTSDGGFVVVGGGDVDGSGDRDVWLVKTDSSGVTCIFGSGSCNVGVSSSQFVHAFDDGSVGPSYGRAVIQTSDGNYVFVALSGNASNISLVKVNDKGQTCTEDLDSSCTGSSGFVKIFNYASGSFGEEAYSLQQTEDGGYVFVGRSASDVGELHDDMLLVKTNSSGETCTNLDSFGECSNGTLQFVRRFEKTNSFNYVGYSVQQTSGDGYIVTGRTNDTSGMGDNLLVLKLDRLGNGPEGTFGVCGPCGNGIIEGTEECDDGANGVNNDLCTDSCTMTFCGDGVKQTPNGKGRVEQCDDGMHCADGLKAGGVPGNCTLDSDCTGRGLSDQTCKTRSGGGCDTFCREQLSQVKILDAVFGPAELEPAKDFSSFNIILDSTELGQANISIRVFDALTEAELKTFGPITHNLLLGQQLVDLADDTDFSDPMIGLKEGGSYRVEVTVTHAVLLNLTDTKTVFFTVTKSREGEVVAVPETGLLLVPLVVLIIIGVILKSGK
ncbi:MAG: DUF4215 domain-containing protein [Candidatus Diapherotrites archaeon]|nr:DUF4215 domain-containing protein [Candidatus Diapherotrites archaeon]